MGGFISEELMPEAIRNSRAVFTALNRQSQGSLSARNLARLVHTLHVIRWNGTLRIREGRRLCYFPVVDGEVGCCAGNVAKQRALFLSLFGYPHADYQLVGDGTQRPAGFRDFGDPRRLILQGVFGHVAYEELVWELGRYWSHFPVPTQHLEGWGAKLGRGGVYRLLKALCTGTFSTQTLVGATPRERMAVVRSVYFAIQTDLLAMEVHAGDVVVDLVYTNIRHGHGHRTDGPDRRAHVVTDVSMPCAPDTGAHRPHPRESGPLQLVAIGQ